jgi:5-deoxy-glucuronate isomerase
MSLLVRPTTPDPAGRILAVTPASAGWTHVGFEVFHLAPGQTLDRDTGAREFCLVPVSGSFRVDTGGDCFAGVGGRTSPFEAATDSVYVPAGARFTVTAESQLELALCSAPAKGTLPARRIASGSQPTEIRGQGTNTRHVRDILPATDAAESLLVVEVITPAGHWSSYPPHKHDLDALPDESALEETYYHRIDPPQGFAFQRVYTDDRSIDETMAVEDRCCVLVPRGYHPVGAPHGYRLYYLNVMAGPQRIWKFRNDPAHDWMLRQS